MSELKRVELPNGETYAYREAGKGDKVLVLVHGNMSSSLYWDLLIEALEDKYKIYAPDVRGFGESSYNTPIKDLKDLAEDLKLFADALGIKNFTITGWSLGGPIALLFAIENPDYVAQMILLESGSIKGFPVAKRNLFGKPIPGQYITTKEELEKVEKPILKAYAQKRYGFLKMAYNKTIFGVNRPEPKRYQAYLEEACKQRNKVDVDYALINFNISQEHNGVVQGTGEVDKITCPVLVFIGDQDHVVTLEMAETTAKGIGDNARLVVLKNAGHAPMEDSLAKLVEEINDFIK